MQSLKAVHHILVSSEYSATIGALNTGFDTVNLHRPTAVLGALGHVSRVPRVRFTAVAGAACAALTRRSRLGVAGDDALIGVSAKPVASALRCRGVCIAAQVQRRGSEAAVGWNFIHDVVAQVEFESKP
jgi:hypothetical protein